MFYFGAAPFVFDKRRRVFWEGWKAPREVTDRTALKDIHALQIISEYCFGQYASYYSYELNLVLKDGRRINVVDHANQGKLREDARTLSRFLGAPVWDAT